MKRLFRLIKRIFRLLVGLALLVLLAAGGALWMIRTDWFCHQVEWILPDVLRPHGLQVELRGLRGPLPGSFSFDRLRLADAEGAWLEIEGFRLAWDVMELWGGRIMIRRIEARRMNLVRTPIFPHDQEDTEPPPGSDRRWPERIKEVALNRLRIEQLSLGSALLGEDAEFRVDAEGALVPGENLRLRADLRRTDLPGGAFLVDASFGHPWGEGSLRILLEDEADGLLARWLGPAWSPLRVELAASGPLLDWRGDLTAEVGGATNRYRLCAPFRLRGYKHLESDWSLEQPIVPASVGGHLSIAGPLNRPALDFTCNATNIQVSSFMNYPVAPFDLKAGFSLLSNRLTAAVASSGINECRINGSLDVPVEASLYPPAFSLLRDEPARARLKLDASLALIAPLLQSIQQNAQAVLRGEITLDGTLDQPRLGGFARVQNGSYENLRWGTALRNIQLRLAFRDDRIQIEQAYAQDWLKGTLALTGGLRLGRDGDTTPLDLNLKMNQLQLAGDTRLAVVANADLSARGRLDDLLIEGTTTLQRVMLSLQQSFSVALPELEVIEINKPGATAPASSHPPSHTASRRRIALQLRILAPGQIYIKGRGLDSEWGADLSVEGPVTGPVLKGGLRLVRGSFSFMGRRLGLTQCSIRFDGGWPVVPQVDILAAATTQEMQIYLRIFGPLHRLQMEMHSDPSRPKNEILAMLLFGKSPSELSALEAMRMAYGINLLTGGFDALRALDSQTFIPLDQIGLRQGSNDDTMVTVGKYLNDYVYLEADKSLKGESQALRVQVSLTHSLQLRAQASNDEEEGQSLYLRWHRDYGGPRR